MNIKLDRLKSFLLVAEESNLTRAAARRHSTPSAVSEHLRNLEEEFQIVLFKRSKQGMKLTAAGERLLMPVRQVFSSVEDVRNMALSLRVTPKANLRIGLNSPPEYLRVDQLLRQKATALPHINLEMRTRSSLQLIEDVLSEELDLGYVYGKWSDSRLHVARLSPIRISVVGPKDCGLEEFPTNVAARRNLPWVWPSQECPFFDFMSELLGPEANVSGAVTSSDDEYSTVVMVKAGMGFGLVEHHYGLQAQQRDSIRLFEEPSMTTDLSLVCGVRAYEKAEVRALFDLIAGQWLEHS
jgi:DNA-binding transcriptional LysR family regulator